MEPNVKNCDVIDNQLTRIQPSIDVMQDGEIENNYVDQIQELDNNGEQWIERQREAIVGDDLNLDDCELKGNDTGNPDKNVIVGDMGICDGFTKVGCKNSDKTCVKGCLDMNVDDMSLVKEGCIINDKALFCDTEKSADVVYQTQNKGTNDTLFNSIDLGKNIETKSTTLSEGQNSCRRDFCTEPESKGNKQDVASTSLSSAAFASKMNCISGDCLTSSKSSLLSSRSSSTWASTGGDNSQGASISSATDDKSQSFYNVKWVRFKDVKLPIIMQNENGPCPLIAIMNVLLLQRRISLPVMTDIVTSAQIMGYLGECIFENAAKNVTNEQLANYEQNMHDAMTVFHRLQTGLDVNVRFTGVCDFEYTSETVIFDLLDVRLYHGWLVDPQESPEYLAAVGNYSYNQLVERIVSNKSSSDAVLITDALIAESFLDHSMSQLTYHGLCELSTTVKDGQLSVFFRNNHFSTLYKHKGELFLLVTDQGFLMEPAVVWETLSNVEGDCHFVDANFRTYCRPDIPLDMDVSVSPEIQINNDYQLALSLQQEQQSCDTASTNQTMPTATSLPAIYKTSQSLYQQEQTKSEFVIFLVEHWNYVFRLQSKLFLNMDHQAVHQCTT